MSKNVDAVCIDEVHVTYRCPNPECKDGFHRHGSCGDYETNRVENRSSHCPHDCCNVDIVISDETLRGNFRRLSRKGYKVVNKKRYRLNDDKLQFFLDM
tara:strand:- start:397 stop:693 length:297 start_codon:yes stop_codon:yes gene_type:complete